ncbi:MAG: DUF2336 domain-containing protein [Sphingomonadales bacterium]
MDVEDRAQIADLVRLAQNKSDKARKLLVENISDLFLTPENRLNDHERALMSDILCKLIENIEVSVRKALAERLATIDDVPPDLIRLLANEEVTIARPILEKSLALQDPDLIEVIRNRTNEHRMCIAFRQGVSSKVSDAIIEYGDADVIEALLKNPDAELSEQSMEYLVAESRRVDRFQEPLLLHNELPPRLAHRMFWWVSAALRRHIMVRYVATEHELDDAIVDATKRALSDHDPQDAIEIRAHRLVHRLLKSGELTIAFLIQALRQQRIPVFIAGLAELAEIEYKTAYCIFSDPGGECLAVLCKATGVERGDFTTIFLLLEHARGRLYPMDPGMLKRNLDLFDSVKRSNAKAALRYWQRDSEFQMAIDDVGKA